MTSGALDGMNDHQFMIFLQKATRAFTSQRDVPVQERSPILD